MSKERNQNTAMNISLTSGCDVQSRDYYQSAGNDISEEDLMDPMSDLDDMCEEELNF